MKNTETYYLIRYFNGLDESGDPIVVSKQEWDEFYSQDKEDYRAGGYDDCPIYRTSEWMVLEMGTIAEIERAEEEFYAR